MDYNQNCFYQRIGNDMDVQFIINNTVGNLYWKDTEGRYLGCNKAYSDMIGLNSPDDIVGKTDRDLFLKSMGKKKINHLMEFDQSIMKSGIEKLINEEGVDAQGRFAIYLTKKIPLRDNKKQIIGIMGTSIDITKEKEAEIAKRAFISNIEHDLRTPFSGVSGVAQILYDDTDDPKLKEMLGWMLRLKLV